MDIELKKVFDRIALSWYNFRHRSIFKEELEELAAIWKQGKLLNLGCGHGADFLAFRDNFDLYGVDFSSGMLKQAQKYAAKFKYDVSLVEADICCLPFADSTFDWAIAVATYHHVKGKEERLKALIELRRVLKPGAEAFITVWNKGQPAFWFKTKDVKIPWREKETTLLRHYHLFSYHEAKKLALKAGFKVLSLKPEKRYRLPIKYFSRNICLLVKKED
ncbi:MAG: class I SAM-dependent methyltransferase [Dehalococcoidales bacterium]|nr:class I SAM-dependent methyltransferase [Dehalococcoidales bacterium]